MINPIASVREFFQGLGYGWAGPGRNGNLDPGNRGNPPGRPPSPLGSYQWIIPQMYADQRIVGIESIPVKFRDWDEFGVNVYDTSGLTGGGVATPKSGVPTVKPTQTAIFDTATQTYNFAWRDDGTGDDDAQDDDEYE